MTKPSLRDEAFDFVKGVLVCLMVVYHVMNVVTTAEPDAYRYLRFVSGSFIFLSGVAISHYLSASFLADPARGTSKLITRGAKLILLFTLLNLAIRLTGVGNAAKSQLGVADFLSQADTIYLVGNSNAASFVILLPIGYLLMVAPLFLRFAGPTRRTATVGILLVTMALAAALGNPTRSIVAEFMIVGLLGLCLGALPWVATSVATSPRRGGLFSVVALAASLALTAHLDFNLALYAVGVALVIKFLYDSATHVRFDRAMSDAIVVLGRYSLFAYILQIGVIQLIFRATGLRRWSVGAEAAAFMACTVGLLVATCLLLDWLRRRSLVVDRAYRLVFA
jgi:fucose 4-O-acetylase-like acetyltransferase